MKTLFLLNLLFLSFYYSTQAQLSIDSIQEIILVDYVNYNYEKVRSKEYKILLDYKKNKVYRYNVISISRSEFMDTKRKAMSQKYNRLRQKWDNRYYKTRDTIYRKKEREYREWFWAKSETDYDKYIKRVEDKKFARKKIDRSLLDNLIAALNEPAIDFETYIYDEFLPMAAWFEEHREDLKNYVRDSKDIYFKYKDSLLLEIDSFDFSIFEAGDTVDQKNIDFFNMLVQDGEIDTTQPISSFDKRLLLSNNQNIIKDNYAIGGSMSYYPHLSISIVTQNQDTIYYSTSSQKHPPLPWELWVDEDTQIEYWNININKAFYVLLPKRPKLNRWRLNETKYAPMFRWFLREHL